VRLCTVAGTLTNPQAPAALAAAGIAMINAVGSSGGFFGPSLIGFFRTLGGGDAAGYYALGALALTGGAICLVLRRMSAFRPDVALPDPA
jgi:ACS family tartrate transporter-like MFS transporter